MAKSRYNKFVKFLKPTNFSSYPIKTRKASDVFIWNNKIYHYRSGKRSNKTLSSSDSQNMKDTIVKVGK